MSPSFVCLLALVAVAAAYAPPEPEPARCHSKHLDKYFYNGDKWTDADCQSAECVDGKANLVSCKAVSELDASRPNARCRQVPGAAGAEHPACCPTVICDQCYSTQLDRVFEDGAVWTESGCTRVTCSKGEISAVGCPVTKLKAGCRMEPGPAAAEHPHCCPQPACPRPDQCYYEPLKQVFDDGAVWNEEPCTEITCKAGKAVSVGCGDVAARPGCVLKHAPAGAKYPTCCPKEHCPTTTPATTTPAPTKGGYY